MSPDPYAAAERIRDEMARAICPDEWSEHDEGRGHCSIQAGHRVLESIGAASRVYRYLYEAGFNLPAPPPKG